MGRDIGFDAIHVLVCCLMYFDLFIMYAILFSVI
jgi:hypothetical protein